MSTPEPPFDLLVRGGLLVVPGGPAGVTVVEGDVAVRDGRIVGVGDLPHRSAGRVLDATDSVVMPGLVNSHMHECLERGIFEDLPFTRWLQEFALPKDRAYEPRHQRAAALLNQLEMIRGGTTTFIDIFRHPDQAAEVAVSSGLRAVISPQVIDRPPGPGETLEANLDFVQRWQDRCPRVRPWFGPHALYSCDEETFAVMSEEAARRGLGMHTHLAESGAETAEIVERTGLRPAAYLDRLIGPGHPVLVAHGVHLDAADIDLVAARRWAVAHCPTSNMKLGNGTAPVPEMIAAGVTVGLGTDSVMTNNDLDMFEEMRLAALVQKLRLGDAEVMPVGQVIGLATTASAAAVGLGGITGSLREGAAADLIVVGLDQPHMWPVQRGELSNVAEHMVYSAHASDVRSTVVAGRILMEDRVVATIDAAEVRDLVARETADLLIKAGILRG
ncbi:MAG: amidohydrolase [Acidobacteriota bacterium]|nr:amidohydrolase [Acidobacteriota bacterium]